MITANMFVGVEAGYLGNEATITNPNIAASIVRCRFEDFGKLSEIYGLLGYVIKPGAVVYGTIRGCPAGGEAAALVTLRADSMDQIMNVATVLQNSLHQSTLSVCIDENSNGSLTHNCGSITCGFTVYVEKRSLLDIGKIWQEEDAKRNKNCIEDGKEQIAEISCGLCDEGEGAILIRADANPDRIGGRFDLWESAVHETLQGLERRLEIKLHPTFHNSTFVYLKL